MAGVQTQNSVLTVGIIAASATIIVAVIGNAITSINNALSRKNEHKLAILKVLLEAGYKEYEFRTKQDLETAKSEGLKPRIKSFTEYVIFYRELSQLFTKKNISEKDLINSLSKNKDLIDAYYENRDFYQPEYHKLPNEANKPADVFWEKVVSALKNWF